MMKVKLYKQIQFSDGYIFYEQKNGRYTDTKKEEDCDLSFDCWKDIQDATTFIPFFKTGRFITQNH